jgi:hypothetical protein
LAADGSSVFLGAYDHALSVTSGAGGGVRVREGTARPMLWRLMSEDADESVSLLSSHVIDAMPFCDRQPAASFAYPDSSIAAYLSSASPLASFGAVERAAANLLARDISTRLHDSADGSPLDGLSAGGVAWPALRPAQRLALPWATLMADYPPQTARLHLSSDGAETSLAVPAADLRASLRNVPGAIPYWTRSPYLPQGATPPGDEALYVRSDGAVSHAQVGDSYGVRPVAALDWSRVVCARRVTDAPSSALDVAADATLHAGAVASGGDYYAADKSASPDAESYRLTLVDDSVGLGALTTSRSESLSAEGTSTVCVRSGEPISLHGSLSGAAEHLAYKIVRDTPQGRRVVALGSSGDANLSIPTYALDGTSPLSQGTYSVHVWGERGRTASSDEASRPIHFTLHVDSTPPRTAADPPGSDTWMPADATVTLTASDAASGVREIRWSLDGQREVVVSGRASCEVPISGDGIHTLEFRATDAAGNEEAANVATYAVDTTPPKTTAPDSGTYPPREITLSATDLPHLARGGASSGVASIRYRLQGGPVTDYTSPIPLTAPGVYLLQYWALDAAGNAEEPSVVTYAIKVPPASMRLSHEVATLHVGASLKLGATPIPQGSDGGVVWSSSDEGVAGVSPDGVVRAIGPGRATITAQAAFGTARASLVVEVENAVRAIAASHKTVHVTKGRTLRVPLVAYAADDSPVTLFWETGRGRAATVVNSAKGGVYEPRGEVTSAANGAHVLKIKGNRLGRTVVSVKSRNGQGIRIVVKVHRKGSAKPPGPLKVLRAPKSSRLELKSSVRLKAKVASGIPVDAVARWKSSNPRVIKVDAAGRVSALKSGKAKVTVRVGRLKASVKLTSVRWGR